MSESPSTDIGNENGNDHRFGNGHLNGSGDETAAAPAQPRRVAARPRVAEDRSRCPSRSRRRCPYSWPHSKLMTH